MKDCIFCQIVRGMVPSYRVYEDDTFLAFLDVFPKSKGHTLIIPKKHYRWTYEVKEFQEYWSIAQKVTTSLQKVLKPKWVNYFTHGAIAHAHIHILPRFESVDTAEVVPSKGVVIPPEEMKLLTEQIREFDRLLRIQSQMLFFLFQN